MTDWDRSRHWELRKYVHRATGLRIHFTAPPSAAELHAARRVFGILAALTPAAASEALTTPGGFDLGEYAPPVAEGLLDRARQMGLAVVAHDATQVGYIPMDITEGTVLLHIDDPRTAERVIREMREAGVPVREGGDSEPGAR